MEERRLIEAMQRVLITCADLVSAERAFERAKVHARDLGATEEEIAVAITLVERTAGRV